MRILQKAAEIEGILRDIESQLDNEAEQDREYRAQHGAWTAVASEQLAREMRMDPQTTASCCFRLESDALVRRHECRRQSIQSQLVDNARPAQPWMRGCHR